MVTEMTITEALAELRLIDKKMEKARQIANANVSRMSHVEDPHKEGSHVLVSRELQSIRDLGVRRVRIREAISQANLKIKIKIGKLDQSLSSWLTWKREVAIPEQNTIQGIADRAQKAFAQAQSNPQLYRENKDDEPQLAKLVLNVDIADLNAEALEIEETLGVLDGKMTLMNSTTVIKIK